MELRHLRYFVAVVERGSGTAAASAVHITQPSPSRQVGQLKCDLGIELFVREGGRVQLTPADAGGPRALVRRLLPRAAAASPFTDTHACSLNGL